MGCRTRKPQGDLLRVIRRPDGTLDVDRTAPGRGAWLCPDRRCVEQAARRKAFGRALRAELADGAVESLRARMEEQYH